MAARYWIGAASSAPGNTANWSTSSGGGGGASVPGSSDDVTFDGNGNVNCTFDDSYTWKSITFLVGYTAICDLGDSGYQLTIADGGNFTSTTGGSGAFDHGNGTIYMTNGNFDNRFMTTWTKGTGLLSMGGSSGTLSSSATGMDIYALTIRSGATIAVNNCDIYGTVTLDGQLSVNASRTVNLYGVSTLVMNDGSKLTGSGLFDLYMPGTGEGVTTKHSNSTIDVATFRISDPASGAVLAPGTYSPTLFQLRQDTTGSYALRLNGTYIFTGTNFELKHHGAGGTLTLDNDTYDPNITIRGNVYYTITSGGSIAWTRGTDTLTFDGASNQSIDVNDQSLEAIVINKSAGTLTFADGFTAASIDHQDGTVAVPNDTCVTDGNWNMAPGTELTDPAGTTFDINGNASWCGSSRAVPLDLTGSAKWDFDVAGTAKFVNCDVAYCDATDGSAVNASRGCTDSDDNTNVTFTGAFTPLALLGVGA